MRYLIFNSDIYIRQQEILKLIPCRCYNNTYYGGFTYEQKVK